MEVYPYLWIPEFSCIRKAESIASADNLQLDPFIRFDRTSTCDGQTDGHHIIALYRSMHYDVAARLVLYRVGLDQRSYSTSGPVSRPTGMGDRRRTCKPSATQANSASYHQLDGK